MSKKENNTKGNANDYDRIFKENAEAIFMPLIKRELGLNIKYYQALPEKFTKTLEREVDFLYRVKDEDDKEFLLHIEFQTQDDKNMIYRMGFYHGLAWHKYKKPIKHVVVFLGKGKSKMRSTLEPEERFDGFDLINIYEFDRNQLLSSQVPEEVVMAILGHFDKKQLEQIIRLIVRQLKRVCQYEKDVSKYLQQLIILSRMRNLEKETIKILDAMPITYDITQDGLYLRGEEVGLEQGLEQGEEIGEAKSLKKVTLRCLDEGMDYTKISLLTGLSEEKIAEIDQERQKSIED